MPNEKQLFIIGSGFSSLSAACYLQKHGYQVVVIEKNEQLGGRASFLREANFSFDMGPSWYWMPDIFERFFADFDKKVSDFYKLQKLSPAYRVYFDKETHYDIGGELEDIYQLFEKIDPGSSKRLKIFIKNAKTNYEIAMKDLVYQPGLSILELVSWETIKRLNLFVKTMSQEVSKITSNKHLKSILEFPVLFLGAEPKKTPAFYNFMNYADFGLGTWYPQGGMYEIIKGIEKLAKELGVQFILNEEITKINIKDNAVVSISTKKGEYFCSILVSGADYQHTESLLNKEYRNYSLRYWDKKTFAPSCLLYYIGYKGSLKNVLHHTLFFDTEFDKHINEIYNDKKFPSAPLFYANFPSKTDSNLAPEGMETAFFLIPTAIDLNDTENIHDFYFSAIIERIEELTQQEFKNKIVFKKSFGINDFKSRYHSYKGNAYGLANTLLQTSILRPSIKNKKIKNLYYTGQLTVPGPGVPPALISGKLVSEEIIKQKNA